MYVAFVGSSRFGNNCESYLQLYRSKAVDGEVVVVVVAEVVVVVVVVVEGVVVVVVVEVVVVVVVVVMVVVVVVVGFVEVVVVSVVVGPLPGQSSSGTLFTQSQTYILGLNLSSGRHWCSYSLPCAHWRNLVQSVW